MAAINGVMDHHSESLNTSAHLGKRKRSASPEKKFDLNDEGASRFQQKLRRSVHLSSSSGPVSTLLKHSLPSTDVHPPTSKRIRLSSASPEDDTIEKRIFSGSYTSVEQVHQDLVRLIKVVSSENPRVHVNGDAQQPSGSTDTLYEAAAEFIQSLSSGNAAITKKKLDYSHDEPTHHTGQVITLRSQTEKGTQLLYSGLQTQDAKTGRINSVDGRRLPNGFDLTEPATMDTAMLAPPKDRRLFGDVFRPHSSLKPLEVPRSRVTTFRGNVLKFSNEVPLEKSSSLNRLDHKFQQLPVSSWLSYKLSDQQLARRSRGRSLAQGDLRAVLIANDVVPQDTEDATALFKKAFSSFAPTTDTSKAVVSVGDRDRQWWSKNGSKRLRSIFRSPVIEEEPTDITDRTGEVTEETFGDVVSSFQPEEQEDPFINTDDPESVDDILTEISELLETLYSHQQIRSLDTRATPASYKPTPSEFNTYELLRSQLAILISSLPPFAISKLDGNKLASLNISTNILVDTIDYRGTAQPDEHTLSLYRAAQPAPRPQPQPQQPTQPPTQQRPTYQTPASTNRYNTTNNNLSAYAQNLGVAAARYSQAANYQTPNSIQRPFQSSPFQSAAGGYNAQSTIQQFQRQGGLANGFGGYAGGGVAGGAGATALGQTQTPTPSNVQTPTQMQAQAQSQGHGQTSSLARYQITAQKKIPYENNNLVHANANTPGHVVGASSADGSRLGSGSASPAKSVSAVNGGGVGAHGFGQGGPVGGGQGGYQQSQPQSQPQPQLQQPLSKGNHPASTPSVGGGVGGGVNGVAGTGTP